MWLPCSNVANYTSSSERDWKVSAKSFDQTLHNFGFIRFHLARFVITPNERKKPIDVIGKSKDTTWLSTSHHVLTVRERNYSTIMRRFFLRQGRVGVAFPRRIFPVAFEWEEVLCQTTAWLEHNDKRWEHFFSVFNSRLTAFGNCWKMKKHKLFPTPRSPPPSSNSRKTFVEANELYIKV